NCDEFAMGSSNENSVYGPVHNAHNPQRVAGGSSGGSAVSVLADLCMLSLGSDTGGSVRQPADYCGILGFKPGYGQISRYGLIAYASSFDQIGIFGKQVEDIALLFDCMNIPDPKDSTMQTQKPVDTFPLLSSSPEKKYKFCYLPACLDHPALDKEIQTHIQQLLKDLSQDGHSVTAEKFDWLKYLVPTYYVLSTAEASSNLSRYDGIRYGHNSPIKTDNLNAFYTQNRTEGFGTEVKKRIMLGNFVLSSGYYDAYFHKAQQVRRLLTDRIEELFSTYDALILPTVPAPAPFLGQKNNDSLAVYLSDIYTVFANLTGVPACSVPLFSHSHNMPVGVQVMTNKTDELTLLRVASLLMQQYRR
ncbi:MAG TPA: amidase family protein, partial [Cyclobacteriaceae bacterium]|nr:amidase family protein [Cyclobacteriaceae bacterium]